MLTSLALLACVTLVAMATRLRHTQRRVAAAIANIRSADAVRVSLLSYARESDLAYLTSQPAYELTRQRTATDLRAQIDDAKAKALDDDQRRLLGTADQQIQRYLEVRRDAEHRAASLQDILAMATTPLQDSLSTLRRLVELDGRAVAEAESKAQRWDEIGRLAGITIALFMLAGFVIVLVLLQRLVLAPLLSLSDGINRLAAGDRQARIAPSGTAEFQRTAGAFNDLADRLARHEEERRTFLAGVAHDLRNPLSALRLRVQVIERAKEMPPPQKLRDTIAVMGGQVTRLDRMVGDLLDANQIASGHLELHLESIDVRDAAREVIELYREAAGARPLSLSVPDAPVTVICDGMRVAQVLNNLVSNAIKYSPRGGEVALRVRLDGANALIDVTDHGIGIPPTELGHVFDPFRRGAASREAIPGVGLGLSVARQLVEAHGGRIDVESTLGAGSTFTVRLPLAGPATTHAEEPRQEA